MNKVVPEAVELLRKKEGFAEVAGKNLLKSYLCPAGVWTIGYGSTRLRGQPVTSSTTCTFSEAERQFQQDIESAATVVRRFVKVPMNDYQFSALTLLVQNIGSGAFANSTLLKKILAGSDIYQASKVEFPRWVKGDNNKVLPGLVTRRQEELAIMQKGESFMPESNEQVNLIPTERAAQYFKGMQHQIDAFRYLDQNTPEEIRREFSRRFSPPRVPESPALNSVRLEVPYYSQRDNYRDADRTCFSSACAMLLKYLKPSAIKSDDDYIRTVFSIGDTTFPQVQTAALSRYGVDARFAEGADFEDLKEELRKGRPVPVGWFHRGSVNAPTGGHWSVVIGFDNDGLLVHDPWGDISLLTGRDISRNGQSLHFSYKNFGPRWMPKGLKSYSIFLR